MIPFLKSVVIELLASSHNLSECCIVTPSKRGGSFLRKYFKEYIAAERGKNGESPIMLPEMITISDFVSEVSALEFDSRLDLLFTLYECYCELIDDKNADFERFKGWGETVVSDFNDIDMYDVDAAEIFQNLSDFKEIKSDYLTDEQREVIREYFGEEFPENHVEQFWKHLAKGKKSKPRFLSLWEMLAPLYDKFNAALRMRGLCYAGGGYKEACRRLESHGASVLGWKKIVFVGFNALSTIERKMFSALVSISRRSPNDLSVDFFWDYNGKALDPERGVASAGRFLHKNARKFPSSVDMDKYRDNDYFPEVLKVISCPGNSVQAKVVSEILDEIMQKVDKAAIDAAKVAVVLPDENLLFPVIYSLPEAIDAINLTMGYPLRLTSAASFVALIRKMQLHRRRRDGEVRFSLEDVDLVLAHPVAKMLIGEAVCSRLKNSLAHNRMFDVSARDVMDFASKETAEVREILDRIFAGLPSTADGLDACRYFQTLIETCVNKLQSGEEQNLRLHRDLELTNFEEYLKAVCRLREAMVAHNVNMGWQTAVARIDRLLAGEKVPLQGEPLSGVQVMGMLETRALDFDYVIIPSMNERIFPRRLRAKTVIPNSLRRGYGMATTRFQESIYAYYFYRMISRAKEVYMLYDARQGGLRSGDVSRYLLQIKYLYPEANLQWESRRFSVATSSRPELFVEKTDEVMARLNEFCDPDSKRCLSASSLKNYMACPLKFYLTNVLRIRVEDEPDEFMDAATQGDIFHAVMQNLYDSVPPSPGSSKVEVPKDLIDKWLSMPDEAPGSIKDVIHKVMIEKFARRKTPEQFNHAEQLFVNVIEKYVRWTLEFDHSVAPFEYVGGEINRIVRYPLADGRNVNVKFIIDRVDRIDTPSGSKLRLIDYKTGKDELDFKSVESLFAGGNNAVFQLMMYANMYPLAEDGPEKDEEMLLGIYKIRNLGREDATWCITQAEVPIRSHIPYKPEFVEKFNELVETIMNPEVPFVQNPSLDKCSYCDMRALCRM